MADVVPIVDLAKLVRTTPERLLEQLQEAGVAVKDTTQSVTSEQKKQLLLYLQKIRMGEGAKKEGKITLKRKSISEVEVTQGKNKRIKVKIMRTVAEPEPVLEPPKKEIEPPLQPELTEQEISSEPDVTASPEISVPEVETPPTTISVAEPEQQPAPPPQKSKQPAASTVVSDVTELSEGQKKTGKRRELRFKKKHPEQEDRDTALQGKKMPRRRKKVERWGNQESGKGTLEQSFAKPTAPAVYEVPIPESITVAELARKMSVKAAEVIKVMMGMGAMVTINQPIDQETAILVVEEMGHIPKPLQENILEENINLAALQEDVEPVSRAPVVTIMGHVDHGKTSLLDYIRRTKVTSTEAGGITQHIGAYRVATEKGLICFLDTPGHEAFTAMRARGAQCTDIVILVVAADDGVMPQTIEAIQHARAANVPLIVAVNKMDKPDADPERVKTELSQHGVIAEDWGGDTIFQPISAKTGAGINELLDSILLQAEVLELKAVATGPAKGIVIESRLDKGRGPIASVLVTSGLLHKGDVVLVGGEYGRVRAMTNDDGTQCLNAGPSQPVEILGLSGVPAAGDEVVVAADERRAREVALFRQGRYREVRLAKRQTASLEGLFQQFEEGQENTLNVVLKADVQGSVEAITDALNKISTPEVKVNILASGAGAITESDINLAIASNAVVVGFNVRADAVARQHAGNEGVDLRYYSIIYDLLDEIKSALSGMLRPEVKEQIIGLAVVRDLFGVTKTGVIAGCMVVEGTLRMELPIRVLRNNVVVYEGQFASLRRFKEDVREIREGNECGIGIKNYNDLKVGDQIECYEVVTIKRTLA